MFVVLDGVVDMLYRENRVEKAAVLNVGDIFYASIATEQVAHPVGVVRV
ncbi:hypothetical protein [Vibrio variabilis]|nr:hypothetical protein [Vibrio variabilis]